MPKTAKPSDPKAALEVEQHIMSGYTDSAKTYSHLSVGALVLSVTFFEKLTQTKVVAVSAPLLVAWCAWVIAILSGALYQYVAVRYLQNKSEEWGVIPTVEHPKGLDWLATRPYLVFGTMIVSFMVGTIAFAIVGVMQLQN